MLETAIECFEQGGQLDLAKKAKRQKHALKLESKLWTFDHKERDKLAAKVVIEYLEASLVDEATRVCDSFCPSLLVGLSCRIKKLVS